MWDFPLCWFFFYPKAKVSTKKDCRAIWGIVSEHQNARSEVINDNASKAFKDSRSFFFFALTLKTISTLSRRISLATVALASQVCLWIPSAHAQWNFSSFEQKPHLQKFVLEEIECEWKADGIEIELRSDAVSHLVCCLEYIVVAEVLGSDKRSYCGWYSGCGMQIQTQTDTERRFGCLDMGKCYKN